jgi:Flp pilus assembly pilin Flp
MQIQTRTSMFARIQNAFSTVRRDRRGNVWVEYLVLVAMLGLAGIGAIRTLSGNITSTAGSVGTGITNMTEWKAAGK